MIFFAFFATFAHFAVKGFVHEYGNRAPGAERS
jgi:hypothetical protein